MIIMYIVKEMLILETSTISIFSTVLVLSF